MGEQALKNIDRPVRAYSISLDFPSAQKTAGGDAGTHEPWEIEKPSIAVLPFNNISGDPEQEYFSDGITEDIITDLSKISGLFVVARNTAYTYKNKPVKVQQVSQDLRVGYILEGSVRRVGSRVRVTAQLVEGKGGGPLWADRYDWDLTEIFALQDEITHTIVDHLKVKLLPEEKKDISRVPTGNFEAYAYYLRGRQFLHWHSKSHYVLAKRMFAMAVALDPLYARAYAGIAVAILSSSFTTTLTCRSTAFWRPARRRWILRAVSQKRTLHWPRPVASRATFGSDGGVRSGHRTRSRSV